MGLIRIMDDTLASRVCAGEVITRPVNAVKELLENSLDAGATRIRIELMNGGKRSILIADNGRGMEKDDLSLCLKRHATSKLHAMEDFASLQSYGFRGEALASMSAVARIRLQSRIQGQDCGYEVRAECGREEEPIPCPMEPGTRIELKDLFHTIPARLRFLKSDQYEKSLVVDLVQSFMAIYPQVSFELLHHSERILFSSGDGSSRSLYAEILGISDQNSLIEIPAFQHPILKMKIHGYLTGPAVTRSSPRYLRLFVNQRIVKHSPLVRSLCAAYDSLLGHKRWPVGFFFVEVPPRMMDANVHPMKTEVRIENESILEEFITKKVRSILLNQDLSTPLDREVSTSAAKTRAAAGWMETTRNSPAPTSYQPSLIQEKVKILDPLPEERSVLQRAQRIEVAPGLEIELNSRARTFVEEAAPDLDKKSLKVTHSDSVKDLEEPEASRASLPISELEIIGQLDSTFIIGSVKENMVLIDQHVAQERVLFEEYLSRMRRKCSSTTQSLLVPVKIPLDARATAVLEEACEPLKNLGFHLEIEGEEAIIRGVPDIFNARLDPGFLEDIVGGFEKGLGTARLEDYFREVAAMMACKGSVKAGDSLGSEEMKTLVGALSRCENPYACPHGRPIVVKISLKEICARFQRPYVSRKPAPCQHQSH